MPISPVCLDLSEDGTTLCLYVLVGVELQFWHTDTTKTHVFKSGCTEKHAKLQSCRSYASCLSCLPFMEYKLFDQFTVLGWDDYLVFCAEYDYTFKLVQSLVRFSDKRAAYTNTSAFTKTNWKKPPWTHFCRCEIWLSLMCFCLYTKTFSIHLSVCLSLYPPIQIHNHFPPFSVMCICVCFCFQLSAVVLWQM